MKVIAMLTKISEIIMLLKRFPFAIQNLEAANKMKNAQRHKTAAKMRFVVTTSL